MKPKRLKSIFVTVAIGAGLVAIGPASVAQRHLAKKEAGPVAATTPAPAQIPPAPGSVPVPVTPPSLEQQPASAPQVAFRDGQLTIVARNSSLGAILQEVQTQTGASIDMPANPTERVVGQFGPGPAREVLASLLNGSHFNYVLLGSPQNPDALQKVVLLSKSSVSEQPISASQSAAVQQVPGRPGTIVIPSQDPDDANAQDNTEDMTEPEQAPDDQAEQNNGQQNGMPPAVKTPQQLLQELQRQQQPPPQGSAPPQ